jgi:predicted AlkP superfamily phosphohydrolase/phosphomutase/tetratricopeptide (TPR) repeat protein
MPKKMLLIGWDAADWAIINPLVKSGKMPALATLMAKGGWGNIVTLDPPISPMLWTSIATGKRPYKHGIYGFTEAGPDGNARPVRVTSRSAKAIWNILNDNGLKTNVLGWWPSHPAEPLNGCMVSNFFGVEGAADFLNDAVHPSELADVLAEFILKSEELTPEIVQPFFPEAGNLNSEDDAVLRSVMRILAQTATTHAAATYVLENTEWQFGAVYFDAIDHFCHLAMKYHPPQMPGVDDASFQKYSYIVEAAYRFQDMLLERLLAIAGPNCHVLLVSDHGFESGPNRLMSLPEEPGAPALEHNPYGVLVASGPDFSMQPIYGASLLDVTPTILNFFGLPVASDMDGRVLPIFKTTKAVATVVTFEDGQAVAKNTDASSAIDDVLLSQLAALGYINRTAQPTNETVLAENEYYLARSLADGDMLEQAIARMERLTQIFPKVTRYNRFYASVLLRLGESQKLEALIENWPDSNYKAFVNGLVLLHKNKPVLAAKAFEKIDARGNETLLVQTAQAWLHAGELEMATNYVREALASNPKSQAALNLQGEIYMQREDWEGALTHYFQSLKLLYYQPKIHLNIGICLYWLGYYADSALALQIALQLRPGLLAAADLLKDIYQNHLDEPEKLAALERGNETKPVIVVTGHPRSGTSMMMQILAAGGAPVLADANRLPDANNPRGYLELEAVKDINRDQTFLHDAAGKAVKIVMPLLRFVQPTQPIKVIWMQRDANAILRSQQKMKGESVENAPFNLLQTMKAETRLMEAWLNRYPHIQYIVCKYEDAVGQPVEIAKRLAKFLGPDFNQKSAVGAIDSALNHQSS